MGYTLVAGDDVRVSVPGPAGDFAAYSECVAVADPQSDTVIVASKRFSNTADYTYFLITWTLSGGQWTQGQRPPIPTGVQHCGDPALMCDIEQGRTNVYLVGNPNFDTDHDTDNDVNYGLCVFKSTDLGATWQEPEGSQISKLPGDDKPACVSDTTGGPYDNRLYVTWDSGATTATAVVLFARSTNHALTWEGVAGQEPGSPLHGAGKLSTPIVMPNGNLHVFSILGTSIVVNTSTDGGDSFGDALTVAEGLRLIDATADAPDLPFRVQSLPAVAAVGDSTIVVAWTDTREGPLRIYCRTSTDNGQTWLGPAAGEPCMGLLHPPNRRRSAQSFSTTTSTLSSPRPAVWSCAPTTGITSSPDSEAIGSASSTCSPPCPLGPHQGTRPDQARHGPTVSFRR